MNDKVGRVLLIEEQSSQTSPIADQLGTAAKREFEWIQLAGIAEALAYLTKNRSETVLLELASSNDRNGTEIRAGGGEAEKEPPNIVVVLRRSNPGAETFSTPEQLLSSIRAAFKKQRRFQRSIKIIRRLREREALLRAALERLPDTLLLYPKNRGALNRQRSADPKRPIRLQRRDRSDPSRLPPVENAEKWKELAGQASQRNEELRLNQTRFLPLEGGDVLALIREADEPVRVEHLAFESHTLESIGRLALGLAHEINTPIQYIANNVHFVQMAFADIVRVLETYRRMATSAEAPVKPADIDDLLKRVEQAIRDSRQGTEQVTEIIRATRTFAHPGTAEKSLVDVNRAVERSAAVTRNEWKYVAQLTLTLALDLPLIPAHAVEIQQVLLTLILNAAQSIAEKKQRERGSKGRIVIQTSQREGWAQIAVKDTGNGIPEQLQPRIFEPFFTTKKLGRGSGQGLAIAKFIVAKRHGGKIFFRSVPQEGTVFFVQLPLEARETESEERPLR